MLLIKILTVALLFTLLCLKLETLDTSAFDRKHFLQSEGLFSIKNKKSLKKIRYMFSKLNIPFNFYTVIVFISCGIAIFTGAFIICKKIFPTDTIAIILSVPLLFIPYFILKTFEEKRQRTLENGLNDFLIQLKTALKVNSDIVEALRRIQNSALSPFKEYTKQLLTEINAGKDPDIALRLFAEKININKFTLYIDNVRYCNIYGGDIAGLTLKTQEMINSAIKQKIKRDKDTKSGCIVLYILIGIDIFIYFSFVASNKYYLDIMANSLVGNIILNMNFISIWILVWLSKKIKELVY